MTYWAFAWAGGLAIARYLEEHPDAVAGRRVLDFASGSGVCAIAAMRAGAADVVAVDIDAIAVAAIKLNSKANRVRVSASRRDVLGDEPPDVDVVLAGDCWYDATLAERVLPWLRRVRAAGIDVLVGDPGRRYLPLDDLEELATYDVRTTTELEDMDRKVGRVYRLRPASRSAQAELRARVATAGGARPGCPPRRRVAGPPQARARGAGRRASRAGTRRRTRRPRRSCRSRRSASSRPRSAAACLSARTRIDAPLRPRLTTAIGASSSSASSYLLPEQRLRLVARREHAGPAPPPRSARAPPGGRARAAGPSRPRSTRHERAGLAREPDRRHARASRAARRAASRPGGGRRRRPRTSRA